MQYCRIISLDNNNSVKFTSSRGDNSTTNDSMVMKIAHEQLHMYTNIMYKFWSSTCKTVGEKLQTKLCPQTDGQTDVDYIVGKGKKWWLNQHFFLFPLCFQKFSSLKSSNLYHTLIILTPPEGNRLVVLGFNATLTAKVISWRSVTHMCFLAFSHQYYWNFSFQSHRLLFSHASAEARCENMPERKFASTGDRTHNHQIMSPTCSPLSHPGAT